MKFYLSKMADAAARREARRRKILENSGNRLQKIAGKCSDESIQDSPNRSIRPIPEPEHEIPVIASSNSFGKTLQQNGAVHIEPFIFLQSDHEIDATGDSEVASDLAHLLPSEPRSESAVLPTTLWEKIVSHKYDIVILSLLIQILYGLSLITFDMGGYFFLPVIVYIVTKLVWFPVQNTSNLANVLLLLNGMSQSKVRNIMYVTQCLSVISRDTFVYLFTTICIQSLCITVQNSLVT